MKPILLAILAVSCALLTACDKKSPTTTMVATKVVYSHPNQLIGGFEMVHRQELGTISKKTPSTGQPLTLSDKRVVSFSQITDASDPSKIRVIVESELDGFPPEKQVLEFGSSAPNPPAAEFKNGLRALVTVDTYTN